MSNFWKDIVNGEQSYTIVAGSPGLFAWGNNTLGQLGLGDTYVRYSPTQVGSLTTWASVSTGADFSAAIKTDGSLWTWGFNYGGQLGLGDIYDRSSPTQVGALTNWSQVSCGSNRNTLAVKTDGTLWAWGLNYFSTLGLGDGPGGNVSSPVQVGALTNWAAVATSYAHTLAVKTDGTLWAWGVNTLGLTGRYASGSPVQIGALTNWKHPSVSDQLAGATKTDGTIWMWGSNQYGQLGQGHIAPIYSPVQVGARTDWNKLFVFDRFVFGIPTDQSLWAWGSNSGYGAYKLGLGDNVHRSSPTQVGSELDWSGVEAQYVGPSLGIKTTGTLWAWGSNITYPPGLPSNQASVPTQAGISSIWAALSSGGHSHRLALRT